MIIFDSSSIPPAVFGLPGSNISNSRCLKNKKLTGLICTACHTRTVNSWKLTGLFVISKIS